MNDTNRHYRAIALGRCPHAQTNCVTLPSIQGGHRNSSRRRVLDLTGMFAGIGMKRSRDRVFVGEGVA